MKRQVFLSAIKSLTIISLMFVSLVISAQITKSAADNIVMNMLGNDTLCVVYSMSSSVGRNAIIMTADGEEVVNPYDNAYVYFIDDNPAANWEHACRYCFVNSVNGLYDIVNQHFCPQNHENFIKLYERNVSYGSDWPYTNYNIPQKAPSNGHLYAVLIGGDPKTHNALKIWYDLSCVYTALVNKYGFKEPTCDEEVNHLMVLAHDKITTLINSDDFTMNLHDLNQSGTFYDSLDFLQNINYSKPNIENIFKNLSGELNTYDEIPELTENDQLFVFLCGHGGKAQGKSYFVLNQENGDLIKLYDYDLKNYVQNIKCSQMTFMIDCCHSGGFIDDLMNDALAICKNRAVHTCTDFEHEGYVEQYITRRNRPIEKWQIVDEFVYYWTAASLGYYPILEKHGDHITGPWYQYDNTAIGNFIWSEYFTENNIHNHINYDISPDYNADGIVTMEEAFVFADNLDTYSPTGYYKPYDSIQIGTEYPQSAYESSFTKELITLNGYKGLINDTVSTSAGHRYFLDGSVMVHMNASLKINNGCEIVGNGHTIFNYGSFTTAYNNNLVRLKNVGLVNENSVNFTLSNCIFDTCGLIRNIDAPFSLCQSTLNQTRIKAYSGNPPRDSYSVDIIGNTFNSTIADNTIFLREIPQCKVSGNVITSGDNGIFLHSLVDPYYNYLFTRNSIIDCEETGLVIYKSNAKINNNYIYRNRKGGVSSLNYSSPYVTGDSTAMTMTDTQRIVENSRFQIYSSLNSYPIDFHFNVLRGVGLNNDSILYFESSSGQGNTNFDVIRNCWYPLASSDISSHLYTNGNGSFTYLPIWEPRFMPIPETPPQRMLSVGNGLAENGDYDGASEVYMQLVSDFPNSQEAIAALKALFSIGVVNNGDFAELKDYYLDLLSDDNLGNTADNLANLCDVKMENYYDAVQWYEDKILNPNTTYSERIFAEIDLGDLYLQMNNNGNRGIQGKMAEYIPVSKEAHSARTDYLLSLLPDDIGQNHISSSDVMTENYSSDNAITLSPNPVKGLATLSYTLDRDSNVAISIIDMLGNEIKQIYTGMNNYGLNSYKLDLHDMPDGVYLCRIQADGNDKGTVKIIVKH